MFGNNKAQGEHLPDFLPAECLGARCPNYSGKTCNDTELEWMTADGPKEGRDTSKPPLKKEAKYIIYGQRCLAGAEPKLVAQRVEIYKQEEVSMAKLIAMTGRYGDMPVDIVNGDSVKHVETIVSSDS